VSFDIGILHCVGAASFAATTTAPPRPWSRRGRIPRARRARNGHSTALFAAECQFFLDNVIAGFGFCDKIKKMAPCIGAIYKSRVGFQELALVFTALVTGVECLMTTFLFFWYP